MNDPDKLSDEYLRTVGAKKIPLRPSSGNSIVGAGDEDEDDDEPGIMFLIWPLVLGALAISIVAFFLIARR